MLQGEREFARDNRTLGRFNLTGLPPAPRGVPQIEVSFNIDANGILNVSAKDLATGKQQSIEIKGSSGLSRSEIDTMRKDAETHAEDDRHRREVVDLKNQADAMAYQMEKMLREQGDKIAASDRSNIESAISAVKDAVKGDDAQAIKRAMENLERQSHKVTEEMYKTARAAGAGKASPPPPGQAPKGGKDEKGGDDVIDAEYEVKE